MRGCKKIYKKSANVIRRVDRLCTLKGVRCIFSKRCISSSHNSSSGLCVFVGIAMRIFLNNHSLNRKMIKNINLFLTVLSIPFLNYAFFLITLITILRSAKLNKNIYVAQVKKMVEYDWSRRLNKAFAMLYYCVTREYFLLFFLLNFQNFLSISVYV